MPDLFIDQPIGSDFKGGMTAADVRAKLAELPEGKITARINSPGGDPIEAVNIANMIGEERGTFDAQIDGTAASAVTVIAARAKFVSMVFGGRYMIHDVWKQTVGNAQAHVESARLLDSASDDIAAIYAAKTKQSKEYMRQLMSTETWLSAKQAKAEGFVDHIIDRKPKNCVGLELFNYPKMPPSDDIADLDEVIARRTSYRKVDSRLDIARAL